MPKIKLDDTLHERAQRCAAELGYSSVEEFVAHLVERAVRRHEEGAPDDREAQERRLKGLGYLE